MLTRSEKRSARAREYKFILLNIRLGKQIAQGGSAVICKGIDTETNKEVAVKIEDRRNKHPLLVHESDVYMILRGGVGIPNMRRFGVVGHYNVLVMPLYGPSLEELLILCAGRFTLKTVLMLANQMIDRIEFVHSKSFVHRDIKPQNFLVVGAWEDQNKIYLIDFGLAKKYRDSTDSHIPCRENLMLTGTLRYSSMNHHSLGIAHSRRDDLESLGYVLMYFLNGRLPWQGLRARSKEEKLEKIKSKKRSTSIEALCAGHPREFVLYFEHCRSLQFSDRPDYAYLKRIFLELFIREGFKYDGIFDWILVHREARVYQQSPDFSFEDVD